MGVGAVEVVGWYTAFRLAVVVAVAVVVVAVADTVQTQFSVNTHSNHSWRSFIKTANPFSPQQLHLHRRCVHASYYIPVEPEVWCNYSGIQRLGQTRHCMASIRPSFIVS